MDPQDRGVDALGSTEPVVLGPGCPLPNFVVIGAMRSGSTSLHHHLSRHPDAFMPAGKELHFFDRNFDRGVEWYRSHFEAGLGKVAIGEATPAYMYERETVERMAGILPDARLVAILRNPVDRAYSHYWKNRVRGLESLDFHAAIKAEEARLADRSVRSRYGYVDRGRYVHQLDVVAEHYSKDRLHVIILEEFRADPEGEYASLCRFLGLDSSFVPGDLDQARFEFVSWRSERLRRLTHLLPRRLKPLKRVLSAINVDRGPYPPMEAAIRGELLRRFEGDNQRLAAWLGRDLSQWSS